MTGCFPEPTPRVETVIDRVYVLKECPTFYYNLNIKGSKFSKDVGYSDQTLVIGLDPFLTSLEQNKLARETLNTFVTESNEHIIVPGIPETSNFKRVEKRIFVNRECPSFYYTPEIKARKLTPNFKPDVNETYVVITLDNMVTSLEQNKLARETFNKHVKDINDPTYVEKLKEQYESSTEIILDGIKDTIDIIKTKVVTAAVNKTKKIVTDKITK